SSSPSTSPAWHGGRCGRRSPTPSPPPLLSPPPWGRGGGRRKELPMPETLAGQPYDVHNQLLVSNGHPPDWDNPQTAGRHNLVVLGAGRAGLVSAAGAAGLGARVALVERDFLGGDCLNVGCVPSKALLAAARVAATVRNAGEYGVEVPPGTRVDFAGVMERM